VPDVVSPGDRGLFGPGSVTWKIHAHPVILVGGLRALIIQSLHPLAMAGVAEHSDYKREPIFRLQRTVQYVGTVTFGTTEQARAAGDLVRHVHTYVNGTDPVTGRRYSAEDPETLVWVHCVEVHSFLAAYRAYGGRLSEAEQDGYLAEQVRAAGLVGVPPEIVPASRAEMHDYFAGVRPELVASPLALEAIRFVVSPSFATPALIPAVPLFRILADAAIGLVPRDLRELAGLERSRVRSLSSTAVVAAATALPAIALRLPLAPRALTRGMHEITRLTPFARTAPRLVVRREADAEPEAA
jgi:uncharacterized protein (DUF2236 family)